MCGRFALKDIPNTLAEAFGIELPAIEPRYNITPTQQVVVLLTDSETAKPAFQHLTWGLVPFWAKDKSLAMHCINARAETAHEKPAFRAAFRHRRCLIPASGFYEWRREGRSKTPFYFSSTESSLPLVLAGLWEDWTDGTEHMRSLSILTTTANAVMQPIHDRMPVLLPMADWQRWIDPGAQSPKELVDVLAPCANALLVRRQVGTYVNNAENQGPECLAAITDSGY